MKKEVPIINSTKLEYRVIEVDEGCAEVIQEALNDNWALVPTPHTTLVFLAKRV